MKVNANLIDICEGDEGLMYEFEVLFPDAPKKVMILEDLIDKKDLDIGEKVEINIQFHYYKGDGSLL